MPRRYRTVKHQDDHETTACKALWAAVIQQAIADAVNVTGVNKSGYKAKIKAEAITFLTTTDSNFAFEAVGLDPGTARKAIRITLGIIS